MSNQNDIQKLFAIVRSDDLSKYSQEELKVICEKYQKLWSEACRLVNQQQGKKS